MFGLTAFIEQKENDNNDNLCKIHGGLLHCFSTNLCIDAYDIIQWLVISADEKYM